MIEEWKWPTAETGPRFEIYKHDLTPWDNVIQSCHACNKQAERRTGLWVHDKDSPYMPITNFWVCSETCAEMFILQRC